MTPAEAMLATRDMKLTDKVSTVLGAAAAPGFVDPVQSVGSYPRAEEAGLTDFEMDCRDWGFVFGVAYGIARGEEPYESDSMVCERAMVAAREVFSRFSASDIFTTGAYVRDRADRPDAGAGGWEPDAAPDEEPDVLARAREPVPEYIPVRQPTNPEYGSSRTASRR